MISPENFWDLNEKGWLDLKITVMPLKALGLMWPMAGEKVRFGRVGHWKRMTLFCEWLEREKEI